MRRYEMSCNVLRKVWILPESVYVCDTQLVLLASINIQIWHITRQFDIECLRNVKCEICESYLNLIKICIHINYLNGSCKY